MNALNTNISEINKENISEYIYKIKLNIIGNNVYNLIYNHKDINKIKSIFGIKYEPYMMIIDTIQDVDVYTTSLQNSIYINSVLKEPLQLKNYEFKSKDIERLYINKNIYCDFFEDDNGIRTWIVGDIDKDTVLNLYTKNFMSAKYSDRSILDIDKFIKDKDDSLLLRTIIKESDNRLSRFNYKKFIRFITRYSEFNPIAESIEVDGTYRLKISSFLSFLDMVMPLDSRNLISLLDYTKKDIDMHSNVLIKYLRYINRDEILNNMEVIDKIDITNKNKVDKILKKIGLI